MVKKRSALNSKERLILTVLHRQGGHMTANEISEETGLSYATVRKYIKQLHEKGVISKGE
jgi:uncharacterized membrane protein